MDAEQVIYKKGGGHIDLNTGARLVFKAIPGQYRYWKFFHAARFELWKLGAGAAARSSPRSARRSPTACATSSTATRSCRGRRPVPLSGLQPGHRPQRVTLGTSVGWSDVYPSTYHEQWLDVTGRRGCFAYVHIADPKNHIYESNEDNNEAETIVRLPWRGSGATDARRSAPGAMAIPTAARRPLRREVRHRFGWRGTMCLPRGTAGHDRHWRGRERGKEGAQPGRLLCTPSKKHEAGSRLAWTTFTAHALGRSWTSISTPRTKRSIGCWSGSGHPPAPMTLVPVPYSIASRDHVWVPISKELIRRAPYVESGHSLTRDQELEFCFHYGGLRKRTEVLRRDSAETMTAVPGSTVVPFRPRAHRLTPGLRPRRSGAARR